MQCNHAVIGVVNIGQDREFIDSVQHRFGAARQVEDHLRGLAVSREEPGKWQEIQELRVIELCAEFIQGYLRKPCRNRERILATPEQFCNATCTCAPSGPILQPGAMQYPQIQRNSFRGAVASQTSHIRLTWGYLTSLCLITVLHFSIPSIPVIRRSAVLGDSTAMVAQGGEVHPGVCLMSPSKGRESKRPNSLPIAERTLPSGVQRDCRLGARQEGRSEV